MRPFEFHQTTQLSVLWTMCSAFYQGLHSTVWKTELDASCVSARFRWFFDVKTEPNTMIALVSVILFSLYSSALSQGGYGPDTVKQLSGYITVPGPLNDNGTHLFYWFFEYVNENFPVGFLHCTTFTAPPAPLLLILLLPLPTRDVSYFGQENKTHKQRPLF